MNSLVAVFLVGFAAYVNIGEAAVGAKCKIPSDCGSNEFCSPSCPTTTTTTTGPTTTTTTGPTTTTTTTPETTTTIDGCCAANPTTTTAAAGGPGTADAYMKGASL